MSSESIPPKYKPRLKICGITTLEDARFAAGALVDFIGFIFYEKSPRCISVKDAAEIIQWIDGPKTVGVFVNQSADEINRVIERTGIDLVQLHGDESIELAKQISKPVIKAFRMADDCTSEALNHQVTDWKDFARYFLLDSFSKDQYGGTGKTWNWDSLNTCAGTTPYFLAGGISDKNLHKALRIKPYAVDVSSSLESQPGIKDFEKMEIFIDRWRELTEEETI